MTRNIYEDTLFILFILCLVIGMITPLITNNFQVAYAFATTAILCLTLYHRERIKTVRGM